MTDANSLSRSGLFQVTGNTTNIPDELKSYTGFLLNMKLDSGFVWQLANTSGNSTIFSRVKWGSNFSGWKKSPLTTV